MSYTGRKPSFEQVRTDELVVRQGTDITTSGTITALSVADISLVRLTAATVLQGIVAPISPANNGKKITLVNTNSVSLAIVNESSSATAANRITTGTGRDMVITAGASVTLFYNTGSSRWSVESSSTEFNIDRLKVTTQSVALAADLVIPSLSSGDKAGLIEIISGSGTSLRSIPAGTSGQLLVIVNKSGSVLQVINEDLVPSASNRIVTGTNGPISLQNDASLLLSYFTDNTTASRWRVIGGTGTGNAVEQVSQTGIGVLANYPAGTPLYVDTTTLLWTKANAMAANTAEVAGLISRNLNNDLAEVSLAGEVSGVTASAFVEASLPPKGSVVFLSTTSGKLTISDVTTIGYVSKPIGIVHNVNGASSVDIMFYNQRGIVVGSVNARTQINLGGSAGSSTITPIQDISAYEAGELAGWVLIDATTDYRFYFQTQFAKIPGTSNYNIAVPQTVGSTPPVGFSMDVVSGVVQVTLPALAGFVSAYVNYAINAPAVGTSLPLSVNSASVYTTYKSVTSAYSVTTLDSLIVASGAGTYAVTLPTAVGALGVAYTIKSAMDAGVALTVNTTSSQLIDSVTSRTLATGEFLTVVSDGAKWIVVVSGQDVTATASPSFTGTKVTSLTASRAVQTDASKNLTSAGFSLPATAGSSLQMLSSNGDGTSSWRTAIYNTTVSTSGTLDAATANSFVHTGSGSRTITISNLADGQTVNIQVQGANGNVISWTTTGLTQKTGFTYSNTMTSVNSIYTFIRLGSNVFINSLHGFG
jgi:hypothetical protein